MNISLTDKIVSVLTYYTFGIFGLIWLVYAYLAKKSINSFCMFNIYQSIFISVMLYIISLLWGIAIGFISVVPLIGKFMVFLDVFINQTPMYFSFTLSGFVLMVFLSYLAVLSFLGKKPFVPYVSNIIRSNFGG